MCSSLTSPQTLGLPKPDLPLAGDRFHNKKYSASRLAQSDSLRGVQLLGYIDLCVFVRSTLTERRGQLCRDQVRANFAYLGQRISRAWFCVILFLLRLVYWEGI